MPARTPRRTAHKRTPYRQRAQEQKEHQNEEPNSSLTDIIKYYKEKETIREEYILALKEEVAHLRRASQEIDYPALTGLTISKEKSLLHCKQAIEKEGKVSSIAFTLEETPDGYTYKYKESANIEELPEYLKKEIYFDQNQIKLFFFNVYECVARDE
ncbi:uncharacterized protein NEMAJ01_2362 [Nematocida major]|uniref:uncharacterized protein n=1 Tax=Nematocida major TaxID=1912982 RepID=UPI0020075DC9|nr:uncharacterized protein NEMAJ01_2362 [Nematocida major]KAH9387466.1 hypothetical protein NEMAJ01_2362 [Nematocida major]